MSHFRAIVAAGAALITTTVAVQAADLYGAGGGRGSIKDDNTYMAAPRGCPSWYARIDGGYSSYDRPGLNQVGIDEHVWSRVKDGGNLGGGIGHYFTCNIRGDLTVDHRFNSDMSGFNPNPRAANFGRSTWGYESTAVMANMYYDFNSGSRFTPYIGFGFGAVHNSFGKGKGVIAAGAFDPLTVGFATSVAANDSWHAAGAAMAGFVFNVTERVKLDTGYRFIYLGAGQTGQTAMVGTAATGGPIHVENLHAHEFRVGLRYDIR